MGCIVGKHVAPSNEPVGNHSITTQRPVVNDLFRSPSIRVTAEQQDTTQANTADDTTTVANTPADTTGNNDGGYVSGDTREGGSGSNTVNREAGSNESGAREGEDQVDSIAVERRNDSDETTVEQIGNHVGTSDLNRTDNTNDDTIPSLELPLAESTPRVVDANVRRTRSRRSPRRKAKTLGCMPLCASVHRPPKRSKITGCTYLSNGFLVIVDNRNRQIKLYDTSLKCCSFLEFDNRPFDICELEGSIYLTIPQAKIVQKLSMTFPMLFVTRKLVKRSSFPTEGECRAIIAYKVDLIVSIWFKTRVNTSVADSAWQIQIITKNGQVLRRISHNDDGMALFFDAKYLALTPNKKEIVISEGEDNRVKCLRIETGELTFNHHMEDPRGVACDKSGNIYVLGKHGTIRWILADREYVKVLLKGTRSINYSECITYLKERNTLAVPRNENKIELYKIRNSIHFDPSDV